MDEYYSVFNSQFTITLKGAKILPEFDLMVVLRNIISVLTQSCKFLFMILAGMRLKGIYREAAQNSKVQAILDKFREGIWGLDLHVLSFIMRLVL